jgi:hypothetical protein
MFLKGKSGAGAMGKRQTAIEDLLYKKLNKEKLH